MKVENTITPKRIIITLAIAVFIFEGILMYILNFFQTITPWIIGVIDSAILTIVLFPVLYYFVFRPMMIEIANRTEAEKALLKIKSELEERVANRTRKLENINEKLKSEIRERILAELELKKLARAIINSPISVVITDVNGDIEYVNPKFTDLTGYTEEEVIGKNPRILKSGHQSKEFYQELWDTITAGKEWYGEFCNLNKNNELYWESASIAPVLNEKREITHFVAVKEDITEQRAAREKLKKAKNALQIYSDELRQSNDMKELLLDIITHDLKNPAGVIYGFTKLLLEQDSTDQIVQSINESSDTLLKVIENATALAGVALGESIEKQDINLSRILQDVKTEFEPIAKHADIEIEFQSPGDVFIKANPIISEVFKNYLSNAIKYAKKGKRIILGIEEEDESVKVTITDFGETIPKESRKAIFLRQARLDKEKRGRGLGLAIVKRIADAHGGKVWVEPNIPKGNRFCFEMSKK